MTDTDEAPRRTIPGKCETCWNARWFVARPEWKAGGLRAGNERFPSELWRAAGNLTISALLASKALTPCERCNPHRLPPWADEWKGSQDSSTSGPVTTVAAF